MAFPGEVGLQMLLYPLNSNVVVRTACCTVGIVLPVYSTFKAIETKDEVEQRRWLLYWAAYGTFSVAEVFTDKTLSWFPLYYHVKLAFLVWLQLPSLNGARQLYMNQLRPFLLRHQARFDQITELLNLQAEKFVSSHQAEFKFAKAIFLKVLASVHHMAQDLIHPGQRQPTGPFQGPARRIRDSQSDEED
ncbi:Receptor expression-enhancing protein 4 [Euphorbia peplus]|nr:Receptor expression-enhancing protein 4 [Euphorbia peplus]